MDGKRSLVYGPRLGRLYLLGSMQVQDRNLQRILGLQSFLRCDDLADPAERIVCDLSNLKTLDVVDVSRRLQLAYRFLHYSRRILPFEIIVSLVCKVARLHSSKAILAKQLPQSVAEIGRLVHAIEHAVGFADCYPRALITCYLCLRSGRSCQLIIGSLSPTRKMHAWCVTDAQLPYEALPEHYMYQPLLVLKLMSTGLPLQNA